MKTKNKKRSVHDQNRICQNTEKKVGFTTLTQAETAYESLFTLKKGGL
jgi:hypothetical protein